MDNKGSIAIIILSVAIFLFVSYYGGKKFQSFKMDKEISAELANKEKTILESLKRLKNSQDIKFEILVPTYIPEEYYLSSAMKHAEDGSGVVISYVNAQRTRININYLLVDKNTKADFLQSYQESSYKTEEMANSIIVYKTMDIPAKQRTSDYPGFGKMTVKFGAFSYSFFIDNVMITVANVIDGNGSLVSEKELLKVIDSMIQ